MFAPVVKSVHRGRPPASWRSAGARPSRRRRRPHPPGLPGDRDRPPPRGARAGRSRPPLIEPTPDLSTASLRSCAPSGRCCGSAAGPATRPRSPRPRRAPRRAGPDHLRRGGRAAARPSEPGRLPAPRRGRRAPLGRGRHRDRDRLRPRRRPDPELRPAPAGHPDRDRPGAPDQLPRRRLHRGGRLDRRGISPSATAASGPTSPPPAPRPARPGPDRAALHRRDPLRPPRRRHLVVRHVHPGYWLAGFDTPPAPRRLQVPLGWGTLGHAFPAGLGAALAGTGPAVSISGDGGFRFACGELATLAQEKIPLTAVIVDDGGYGMLRYDQVPGGQRDLRRGPPHTGLRGYGPLVRGGGGNRRRAG